MKRKTTATIVIIVMLVIFCGIFGYIKFTEQTEKPVPEKIKPTVVDHSGEPIENKKVTEEVVWYLWLRHLKKSVLTAGIFLYTRNSRLED